MIGFRIGTELLDVEVGMQINLTLVNPLFSREIGYGSHSLSFSVPLNAKNRRLLGFRDHLSITSYSNEIEVEVLLGGNFWKTGTLKVINVAPITQKVSVAFNLDTSWLADKVNTIKLSSLNLGGDRTIATTGTVGGTFEIRVAAGPTEVIAIQVNETLYSYTSTLGNTKQELVDELKDLINADTNINATATTQANGSHWQLVISPIAPDDPFQVLYGYPSIPYGFSCIPYGLPQASIQFSYIISIYILHFARISGSISTTLSDCGRKQPERDIL